MWFFCIHHLSNCWGTQIWPIPVLFDFAVTCWKHIGVNCFKKWCSLRKMRKLVLNASGWTHSFGFGNRFSPQSMPQDLWPGARFWPWGLHKDKKLTTGLWADNLEPWKSLEVEPRKHVDDLSRSQSLLGVCWCHTLVCLQPKTDIESQNCHISNVGSSKTDCFQMM